MRYSRSIPICNSSLDEQFVLLLDNLLVQVGSESRHNSCLLFPLLRNVLVQLLDLLCLGILNIVTHWQVKATHFLVAFELFEVCLFLDKNIVIVLKLVDKLGEAGHLDLKLVHLVTFLIRQIIINIWLI